MTVVVPASVKPARRRKARAAREKRMLGVAGILLVIALAELLPRTGVVNPRFLPPFSEWISSLAERVQGGEFWFALGDTLVTWFLGLAIAMVAGTVLGMVIGSMQIVKDLTQSTIEFLRPIPSVALIPLVVLTLGTDRPSTLLLVVYASFWQVLLQVMYGAQDVDPVARDTARSYRFRWWVQAYQVVWPTALPYVVTGFRLAASVALILTITGELIIGTPGLGKLISVAQQSGAVASMYGLILVTGLLGVCVNLLARAVEKRLLFWHTSVRREANG
ncbi:ABC transporter permease [Georgenia sp. Z1491]|uniref:ABC transporter permease n=1 Tax=Georgenia sp. Z1491 TaxID=3416707 RepID=UPI003CF22BA7